MTDQLREQQFDILRKLAEQGDLTARGVLNEARKPDSPLHQHPAFTWDLTEAAQKQWLVQARRVIQEFRRECVIVKGKVVALADGLRSTVKQGRTVKLRDWHPIRPEASSPTHPDEDADEDDEAEPAHEVPQTFVHTSAILEDRDLKVEAAATFFRTIRGFRAKW